jgi:hypothetical protein
MSVASYEMLAKRFLPKDWTVRYRDSLTGRCYYRFKRIDTPPPTTLRRLHIFLHECAHIHLHWGEKARIAHRREYEAETWAFSKMRAAGIEPDPRSVERAKRYVRHKIKQALKRGAKNIDADAWEWSEFERHVPEMANAPQGLVFR